MVLQCQAARQRMSPEMTHHSFTRSNGFEPALHRQLANGLDTLSGDDLRILVLGVCSDELEGFKVVPLGTIDFNGRDISSDLGQHVRPSELLRCKVFRTFSKHDSPMLFVLD